jgi:hypothetical protein
MKNTLLAFFAFSGATAFAQDGYVKFNHSDKVHGHIRIFHDKHEHEHEIQIGKSEHDPAPKRYHKRDIAEYAIAGDTFRILKNFAPYEIQEIYYEIVDAHVLRSGKITLMRIKNSHKSLDPKFFSAFHDEKPSKVDHFYVLHDTEGNYLRGVPSKKDSFRITLTEFFDDEDLNAFEAEHGSIHYRDLEKLVAWYNTQ